MPSYEFSTPGGESYDIEAPDLDTAHSTFKNNVAYGGNLPSGQQISAEKAREVGAGYGLSPDEITRNYALQLAQQPPDTESRIAARAMPGVGSYLVSKTPEMSKFEAEHPTQAGVLKGAALAPAAMAGAATAPLWGPYAGPAAKWLAGPLLATALTKGGEHLPDWAKEMAHNFALALTFRSVEKKDH